MCFIFYHPYLLHRDQGTFDIVGKPIIGLVFEIVPNVIISNSTIIEYVICRTLSEGHSMSVLVS